MKTWQKVVVWLIGTLVLWFVVWNWGNPLMDNRPITSVRIQVSTKGTYVSGVVYYANGRFMAVTPGAIREALSNADLYQDERLSVFIFYSGTRRTEAALTGDRDFTLVRIKALRLVSPAAGVPVAQNEVKSKDL